MITLAEIIVVTLLAFALIQAIFAMVFVRVLRTYETPIALDEELPHASILLSLRGADPFLAKGLRRLMQQAYPRYDLRIVADSEGDPSWQVVRDAIDATGFESVHLSALREPNDRCSLKCAALVQLVRDLDETTKVVVFADADLVSHDNWLRELIIPLMDEGVGATHGNRWFWPQKAWWGSLVRYLWNVAAVVPMYIYKIPWGGTFAIRTSVLRDSGLLEKWSQAVVEDAPVRSALNNCGLRIRFVPGLMMVNREDCDLSFSLDFIKRQLTWTRIYHPNWAAVVIHAAATSAILGAAILFGPIALLFGNFIAAQWVGFGIAAYVLVMVALIAILESGVRKVVANRGEAIGKSPTLTAWIKTVLAIPLTQGIHMTAALLAIFRKRVAWRGITYHVRGPWDVRMVGYEPFEQQAESVDSNVSL